ncbi:hypothetical protein C1S70_17730 [Azospirillum argentinense]|uniref:Uncharacterized protein n=1 Tax=Azospirillum argentinense TaxID=2970906 RepID=A0A2K1FYR7_9PROT|nr:hypothetical protein C1S70_17730 [Azospirillum argentinense]
MTALAQDQRQGVQAIAASVRRFRQLGQIDRQGHHRGPVRPHRLQRVRHAARGDDPAHRQGVLDPAFQGGIVIDDKQRAWNHDSPTLRPGNGPALRIAAGGPSVQGALA